MLLGDHACRLIILLPNTIALPIRRSARRAGRFRGRNINRDPVWIDALRGLSDRGPANDHIIAAIRPAVAGWSISRNALHNGWSLRWRHPDTVGEHGAQFDAPDNAVTVSGTGEPAGTAPT
ncbi:hypothetical protein [Paracoccus sp. Ld10]|uniref:hypothetical protein n=1 Tax=Paracoccus sp. Ld10 TaxID=649158 RepID=UPI003863F473